MVVRVLSRPRDEWLRGWWAGFLTAVASLVVAVAIVLAVHALG